VVRNIKASDPGTNSEIDLLGENIWLLVSNRTDWLEYFSTEYIPSMEGSQRSVEMQIRREQRQEAEVLRQQEVSEGDESGEELDT